ncbi:uncharacterized protein TRIADDRAFT_53904 [Trichoplax adhaerens]|uniref:Uncharacterized protein n=1 Tax=Trichoplax adhaerens TaxID=10228 RepID=B3RMC9_TRIAD|nr:hypothetical protein TRIADDRAFT_53904 [Trichoplax adhaerens]EDV27828.1 hypothetical protein TRIADDRAFT_53904 [Trichoplax adhaerens]|eukprot:XP_002109662.1 hypothetical protein TRIADDRAFT_53904 [Trichoplax adhaerens]
MAQMLTFTYCNQSSLVDNEIITLNKEDFANLTQLEELSLAKNDIHTITNAFHGLSSLKTLSMQHNLIGSLEGNSLRNLISMTHLKLAGNNIAELQNPIRHFNLLNLDISSNPITLSKIVGKIDIIVKSYLQTIIASNCLISDIYGIGFHFFTQLSTLVINDNNLEYLDMSSFRKESSKLMELNLSTNKLSDVCKESLAFHFAKIERLDLSRNNINVLEERCFRGLLQLRTLFCNIVYKIFENETCTDFYKEIRLGI